MKRSCLLGLLVPVALAGCGIQCLRWVDEAPSLAGGWEVIARRTSRSPDGRYDAEITEWNGGATTGYEVRVALRSANSKSGDGQDIAYFPNRPPITATWKDAKTLVVTGPLRNLTHRVNGWNGISVRFQDDPG